MDCQVTLRNLLRLDAGVLDSGEQKSLRAAIEQSPRCQRVLALISKHGAAIEAEESWAAILRRRVDLVDAEVIAGYLDGRLAPPAQKELEQLALRDPQLLAELVWHFRADASGISEILVPFAATERILAAGNRLVESAGKTPNGALESVRSERRQATVVPTVRPLEIQMARPVSIASKAGPDRRIRRRMLTAIASLTATATVAAIWLGGGFERFFATDSRMVKLANEPISTPLESTGVAISAQRTEEKDLDRPGILRTIPRESDSEFSSGWVLVDLSEIGDDPVAEQMLDPDASVFHQFNGNISGLEWLMLEGVVALRAPGEEVWFGPYSEKNTANGLEWRTLPGSWAAARLGSLGELVLDVDSSVKVNTSQKEKLISLELAGGRIGLKRLPANVQLRIKLDEVVWDVEVLENDTRLMIDWLAGSPRLAVGKGYAQANDRFLHSSEQMVWSDSQGGRQKSLKDAVAVGPISESLAWLDRPSEKVLVSGAAQAELLASKNVVGELNRLGSARAGAEVVLAQHLPALLAPEAHLLGVLEGADASSRNEALNWLLGLSPRSSKTRQVWLSIARKSGVPDMTREYFRLIQILKNNAPLSEADAVFLSNGLKHERLFVREMSQVLLELRFGNTLRYDAAETDEKSRERVADRWAKEILESYRPVAVPKR